MNTFTFRDNEEYRAIVSKEEQNLLFIHLDVHQWSKEVLYKIRGDLEELLALTDIAGEEVLSFVVPKEIGVKFHKLVKPLDYEEELESGHIVGGWYTGEI